MEHRVPLDSLPRVWFSGVISDFPPFTPAQLGLYIRLWSPSDPVFTCRPPIFLPSGWQVSDYYRERLDDMFSKFSGAP
jgi:hypothetical protein